MMRLCIDYEPHKATRVDTRHGRIVFDIKDDGQVQNPGVFLVMFDGEVPPDQWIEGAIRVRGVLVTDRGEVRLEGNQA